jgi:hypothetical protein
MVLTVKDNVQGVAEATVGIIGGGKVGLNFLNLFSESNLARVVYIIDKDEQAPGMVAARQQNVYTFTDMMKALGTTRTDFIVEVTGSKKVVEMLQKALAGLPTQLITHDMAFILLKVIESHRQKMTDTVRADVQGIESEITNSLRTMASTIGEIKGTMTDLSLLALNARIESVHAGQYGRGFDVVAQRVGECAESVSRMTQRIEEVNSNIVAVAKRIEVSLEKLN